MWKVPWLTVCILLLNIANFIIASGISYPEPATYSRPTTSKPCSPLTNNVNIQEVTAVPYMLTTVTIPDTIFKGSTYTSTIFLKSGASKCWFYYFDNEKKFVLLPDASVLSRSPSGNFWFEIKGESTCSHSIALSMFNFKLSPSYETVCWKMNFLVQSGTFIPCEAVDLSRILTQLSSYLDKSMDDILVIDFEKVPTRNNQLKFTLSFSSRILDCTKCDQHNFHHFTSKFVSPDGMINQVLFDQLFPHYLIIYVHPEIDCGGGTPSVSSTPTRSPTSSTTKSTTKSTTTSTTKSTKMSVTTATTTASTTTTTTIGTPKITTPTAAQCFQPIVVNPIDFIEISPYEAYTFIIPTTTFNRNDYHLSLRPVTSSEVCWYRISDNKLYFFAVDDAINTQQQSGIAFILTAQSSCGLSASFTFHVKIRNKSYSTCLQTNLILKFNSGKCDVESMQKFYTNIQRYILSAGIKKMHMTNWKALHAGTLKITIALSPDICLSCSRQYVDTFKQHFTTVHGDVRPALKQYLSSDFNILYITFFVSGKCSVDERCYPPVVGSVIPSLYIQPGVANVYNIPNSTFTHDSNLMLSLHKTLYKNCWVQLRQPDQQKLDFLPSYEEASYRSSTKHVVTISAAVKICDMSTKQNINVFVKKISNAPCFHIKVTFATQKIYTCMTEPVRNVVNVLVKHLQVQHSDVKVISYSASTTQQNLIDLYFTLSDNVIPCPLRSISSLEAYMKVLVDNQGVINTQFVSLFGGKYSISHVRYSVLPAHKISVLYENSSDSFIPLWMYMLPLLILLAVLILILLLCCCCPSLHRCCAACCFSACSRRSHHVTSYQSHKIYESKGSSSHHASKDVESHVSSVNHIHHTGSSTSLNVLSATGKYDDHVSSKHGNGICNHSFDASEKTQRQRKYSKDDPERIHIESYCDARKSFRSRSYSDGDLLCDKLNLPRIPAYGGSSAYDTRQKVADRSCAVFNSHVDGASTRRQTNTLPIIIKTGKTTIPVKVTARVKKVTNELDLTSFRPSHMRVDRKRAPLILHTTPSTKVTTSNEHIKKEFPVVYVKESCEEDDDQLFMVNETRRRVGRTFKNRFSSFSKDDDILASRRRRFIKLSNDGWS